MHATPRIAWPTDEAILLVVTDGANYTNAIRQVALTLAHRFHQGIYVTANRPSHVLRDSLERSGIPPGRLLFIDCVSSLTGLQPADHATVVHVESPTMMDEMARRAEQALKRQAPHARFLILDSLSTLSVYNGSDSVRGLAQRLVSRLRALKVPGALILVERQAGEELLDVVRPLCDAVVRI
jgi:hypothetical protein